MLTLKMRKMRFLWTGLVGLASLCLVLAISALTSSNISIEQSPILIDQFGYLPSDQKIAVIRDAGPESSSTLPPTAAASSPAFSVRQTATGEIVYSARATPWQQGKTHSQSGDRAWLFDFSSVTAPGEYVVSLSSGQQSAPFEISERVYRKVLVEAVRMFFYQRSGFAKQVPYADRRWQDSAAFLGPNQDTEARYVYEPDNAASARDMRGGWFDAGDTNKYVTYATAPVHQLLSAYTERPQAWTDDFRIPESGNGVPDVLDEVRFELDWLKRMQASDGGVYIKLGTLDFEWGERPSLDRRPRYYAPKCSSAAIAAAGMFAHGALVFQEIDSLKNDAEVLRERALQAWRWFESNTLDPDCDKLDVKAGDADRPIEQQVADAVASAAYLFALTSEEKYSAYIRDHLLVTRPFWDSAWSRYEAYQGDSLLFYAQLENADADIKNRILERIKDLITDNVESYGEARELDPYGAFMPDDQYHWGSNSVKANYGNTNYDIVQYNFDAPKAETYRIRALDSLHYLHGVNPLGIVYLTNMYEAGAEASANEMYHEWFGQGIYRNALTSPNGPAPGYVTGGPNKNYSGSAPLNKALPMRAYLDSSDPKTQMWEITEPAIGYQSAYIKLLSKFVNE